MPTVDKGVRLCVAILAVTVVATLGFATVGADVATAAHETGDHPDWIHEPNHTVRFTSYEPGERAAIKVYASIPQDETYGNGFWNVTFAANWAPEPYSDANGEASCTRQDIRTAGIDRGANDSGTHIDESVISNAKNFWIDTNDDGQTYLMTQLYDRDDIGGPHLYLNYTDQVIVTTNDCFVNPTQTGWYRIGSYLNGTAWTGEYVEGAGLSHYFYICNCTNRSDAIETLGPPPVEGFGHVGSRVKADNEDLDHSPPDNWDLSATREPGEHHGASPTPSPAGTPTVTPTVSGTAVPTGTATASGPGPSTPTPDSAGAVQATATATTADGPGGPDTPNADGAGFTSFVGVLALLLASALIRRR